MKMISNVWPVFDERSRKFETMQMLVRVFKSNNVVLKTWCPRPPLYFLGSCTVLELLVLFMKFVRIKSSILNLMIFVILDLVFQLKLKDCFCNSWIRDEKQDLFNTCECWKAFSDRFWSKFKYWNCGVGKSLFWEKYETAGQYSNELHYIKGPKRVFTSVESLQTRHVSKFWGWKLTFDSWLNIIFYTSYDWKTSFQFLKP